MTSKPSSHSKPSATISDLLLSPHLDRSEVVRLLKPFGFRDWEKADANLQHMAGDPRSRELLAPLLPDLLDSVAETADPDQALNEWDRYLEVGGNRAQLFSYFAQVPHILHLVCVLFGNSPAMAQAFIRDPLLVYWVHNEQVLKSRPTRVWLKAELERAIEVLTTRDRRLDAIRRFFRREMLRVGARDQVRVATVTESYDALSNLADVVIQGVFEIILEDLQERHGVPREPYSRGKAHDAKFFIVAMGKLGGRELNYSSDVDLVYLCSSTDGHTDAEDGQTKLSNVVFFHQLAQELTMALTTATAEGFLYRVDLRLRPEGDVGPMVFSFPDALRYYQSRGRDWERLAFLKARPIAGDLELGKKFMRKLRPFIMGDFQQHPGVIVQTVCSLREQIQAKVVRRGEGPRNVKLSPGGIRDIEWISQSLQLLHCREYPRMLGKNTMKALQRLEAVHLLSAAQGQQLRQAYVFLRDVEHKLQMVHELQTHLLPSSIQDVYQCAIRMGYRRDSPQLTADHFLTDYRRHTGHVQHLVNTLFP
ncbi:MAG: hypothetical protein VST68_05585 [Nitrospirota bacterium]|nr:hypothetical protein [Nitrospirota bacterium]